MITRPMTMLGLAGAVLIGAACGDSTDPDGGGGPSEGARLQVRVEATASSQDVDDTVTIALDGGAPNSSSGGATITYTNVEFGFHDLEIGGLSKNCTVAGGELQTIEIKDPSVTFVFQLSCTPLDAGGGGGGGGSPQA